MDEYRDVQKRCSCVISINLMTVNIKPRQELVSHRYLPKDGICHRNLILVGTGCLNKE